MADFKEYAKKLIEIEGGYVNHPDDLGGATMCGVTLNTFKQYCGAGKTIKDLRNMSYGTWCRSVNLHTHDVHIGQIKITA